MNNLTKAIGLIVLLILNYTTGWEGHLWNKRSVLSSNYDGHRRSYHQKKIKATVPATPVIMGSYRINFGIDLATWEKSTGRAPVQYPARMPNL